LTDAAVRLWQTPRATDGDKGGPNQTLTGAKAEYERKSPGLTATGHLLQMQMSGARSLPKDRTLNPRFVEWLMGWPIAWTDCDSQVTEWFLVKPLKL
jgi:DNA (cytosine-5)-methyltransferase 1